MVDSIRVFDPAFRLLDDSGAPVSGGKAKFYNAGGLVARTVYSDSGLSTSLGSTVITNSDGVFCASAGEGDPVLIYTGTSAYKIIFTDASDNELGLEFDNITGALDTSAFGLDTAIPRTPVVIKSSNYTILDADRGDVVNADPTGGTVTLTLPSAITVGDDWRITIRHIGTANSVIIEGVGGQTINGATSLTLSYQFESATLVSDGANWHVTEDAFIRVPAGTLVPQGRLTPTSATPIITADVISASAVYYTPYIGNLIPLYNGLRFVPYEFTELTLTLASQHTASNIFDIFAFLDGSTLRIGTGPAWTTATAGSGARGSGAGTTQLTRVKGILLNAVSMTARNGTSTYAVSAERATYLGSMFMDGTNGQITCHVSGGQARKWALWNAYNRRHVRLRCWDGTATWNYTTATLRASNNNADNKVTTFFGLADEYLDVRLMQETGQGGGSSGTCQVGIGLNSTTAATGLAATVIVPNGGRDVLAATLMDTPKLGINAYQSLELGGGAGTTTWRGAEANMLLSATYMA
jgi:hypothetical protein